MASLFDLQAKITLDSSKYENSIKNAAKSADKASNSLKNVNSASDTNMNKMKVLGAQYVKAYKNVEALSKAFNKSAKESGITASSTVKLAKNLDKAEKEANELKAKIVSLGKEMQPASEKVNELGNSCEKAGGKMSGLGGKISSLLGKGAIKFAKIGAAAVASAATGIATIATSAVKSYAEYEQLVGGVETLFGAGGKSLQEYADSVGKTTTEASAEYGNLMNAQRQVLANAQGAYETAGMSANQYMNTVTSFAGSLLQSVGGDTVKAAKIADMAITDMSDNANKMGTSMDSVSHAYQGFARGNFMMLDNLKLGYQGTRGEMERLLKDAEAIKAKQGETVDYSISSYADMVDAVHVIQTEMGITGTTANEAKTTITGSMNAAKASFQNLMTAMAGGGPALRVVMGQFVESALTVADNLIPIIQTALEGALQLIQGLGPKIAETLPMLLSTIIPQLFTTATVLIQTLIQGMLDNSDQIVETAFQVLSILVEGLITGIPMILELATQLIVDFCNKITENPEQAIDAGIQLTTAVLNGLITAIPQIIAAGASMIAALIGAWIEKLPDVVAAGADILGKLVDGIESSLESLVEAGKSIVNSVKEGIAAAWDGLVSWFNGIWNNLFSNRKVDVTVNKHESGGASKAIGMDYVPFNGFPATLHRGEAVLTASEAEKWRSGNSVNNSKGFTLIQNINAVPQTPVELAAASRSYLEQARWAVVV